MRKLPEIENKILKVVKEDFLEYGKVPSIRELAKKLGIHYLTIFKYLNVLYSKGILKKNKGSYSINDYFLFSDLEIPYNKKIPFIYGKFKKRKDTLSFYPLLKDCDLIKNLILIMGEMMNRGIKMEEVKCFIAEESLKAGETVKEK